MLTKGEVFEHEILAGTKHTDQPAEEVPEPRDHGKNLTETAHGRRNTKSLILLEYDVLKRNKGYILKWLDAQRAISSRSSLDRKITKI